MSDNNNKNNNKNKNGSKEYTLSDLKTSKIKDSDEFQDEFEMVAEEVELKNDTDMKELWITRIKVLILSGVFATIGNYISSLKGDTPVSPLDALPALCMMFVVIVLGCLMDDVVRKKLKWNLPSIFYISMISILCSIPGLLPWSGYYNEQIGKMGLLSLCTPILAYAGISLAKDLPEFRKQGLGIIIVTLMALIGTYLGSAVVAEVLMRIFGQI